MLFLLLTGCTSREPRIKIVVAAPTSAATPSPALPTAGPRPATATRPPLPPTATATRVVQPTPNAAATARAQSGATRQAEINVAVAAQLALLGQGWPGQSPDAAGKPAAIVSHSRSTRLVLAHYFTWFDESNWDDCNISAGDAPLVPYNSDSPATVANHIQMAREIGLDGFLLHWFAPNDRTDHNFETLLQQSAGTNFASTVVFSRHFWPGTPAAGPQTIAAALRHILTRYGGHPNFLRVDGKPVIFFTDMYRTPPTGQSPVDFWSQMRAQVDPQRQSVWIAEGLDPAYLDVFDGMYVFKITHAGYPADFKKSAEWGRRVRAWGEKSGQEKLWLATISPGWDDTRSGCKTDLRVGSNAHRVGRVDGKTYRATFEAALQSNPNWLLVGSFNEWVEGTYIEPSRRYGDRYMQLTQEFAREFRQR